MLFLKRLLTALVLLGLIFIALRTIGISVGAAVEGAKAGYALQQQRGAGAPISVQEGAMMGAKAGMKFQADYGQRIGLGALGVATVLALWMAFGGVLPWCKEEKPPPLPANNPYYPSR